MPKYENSVIYKLKHNEDYDDTNIYVGSTSNFKNRKNCHKTRCYNEKDKKHNYPIYQYIRANGGWDEWVMIPIEPYACNSKKELEIRERHHIDLLRPKFNKVKPGRTIKEWREDYKEQIAEKEKQHRDANKKQVLEYHKQYRLANKEKISEREKQKVICEYCGFESTKYNLKNHQKSKKCLKSQEDNVAR